MNKLHKIFSVVLTAAVAMSLLVVSGVAPVSADNNLWSQVTTPSKTNQVMANNITSSCFLTTASNGDLYAYIQTTSTAVPPVVTDNLARSTNGGRSWTYVVAPGHINAIFCAKTEANVVYFSVGNTLYKSTDSGATFATRGTVTAGETIKAIGAALAGGSYKVMVGTASDVGFTGNTYFQDEGQFFLSFTPFGTWGVRGNVMDLKLSPNFAVDQGIVALATTDGASAMVNFSTGGGVWGANLMSVPLPTGAGFIIGEIGLPSDFTASAAIFFVGVTGTASAVAPITAPGLYRVTGSTAVVAPTLLDAGQAASVDVVGAFATASIMYGTSGGTIRYSTNSGQSWTSGAKLPVLPAGIVWVTLKSDYATSLTAYAEIAGNGGSCAPNDESGFFMSTDSGKDWNGISLLNSTIADINMNQLAMASNGDMFMITSSTATGNHSLWRYFGGNWERVIGNVASTALNMIAVSPNYVTDKAVFYVDAANLINYSTNNGNTFSKQSVSAGTIAALQVLDLNTFVAATASGIVRTTNNGFIWNTVSPSSVSTIVRSSDGTTLAAYTSTGAIIKSADLGATWTTASTTVLMAGVTAIAFQNGSNNIIWATTAAGLFSIDLSATTVVWSGNMAGATGGLDSALFANGVAVGSGIAPTGSTVTYALNSANGNVARNLSVDSTISGNITAGATPLFATASALFVSPAVGANKLTVIADSNKIFTYTDQLAVAVAGVTAAATTGTNSYSTAVINWTAMAGADRYAVAFTAGSTAVTDPYTATFATGGNSVNGTTFTITGVVNQVPVLSPNTTYTVSVWAVRTSATGNATTLSFAGTKTFSTQPGTVGVPVNLAPAAGSTGISITPGLAWGAVAGATSYTVELSTVNTFATLVGTKQTTTIPAFAWTTPALAYSTTYYWRVVAITATGSSDPVVSVFTTMGAPATVPTGTTTPPITITNTSVVVTTASTTTPAYVWAIIGIGALLVIVVIVLIVRTRRVA